MGERSRRPLLGRQTSSLALRKPTSPLPLLALLWILQVGLGSALPLLALVAGRYSILVEVRLPKQSSWADSFLSASLFS